MPRYVDTRQHVPTCQLLQVWHGSRRYRLRILHAGEEVHGAGRREHPARRSPEHVHDVYHIVLYTAGRNRLSLGGDRHRVRRGTFVLTSPGEGHSFGRNDWGAVTYREITFALEAGDQALRIPFHELLGLYAGARLAEQDYPVALSESRVRRAAWLFDRLFDGLSAEPDRFWLGIYRSVADLLAFVVETVYRREPSHLGIAVDPAARAYAWIEAHYSERLTVAGLAGSVGLSAGHFSRLFKARYGLSPIRFQQRIRIAAARNLLLSTNLRCKEIAWRCGFSDEYFFSKTFKKLVGCPPRRFRHGARGAKPGS